MRAAEIAARHGCPVFSSIEALGEAADAVSVVVPTDRHAQVALPLLAQGCHLLIEKPICASLAEAEQGAAEHVARVARRPHGVKDRADAFDGERGERIDGITAFLEMKTVWHPIGS